MDEATKEVVEGLKGASGAKELYGICRGGGSGRLGRISSNKDLGVGGTSSGGHEHKDQGIQEFTWLGINFRARRMNGTLLHDVHQHSLRNEHTGSHTWSDLACFGSAVSCGSGF